MIQIVAEERASSLICPNINHLEMRIGIHTGKVTGGMIGTKTVNYDIYGQDVLIANKVQQNGVCGKVSISEATYELLSRNMGVFSQFLMDSHSEIVLESLGLSVQTYLVSLPVLTHVEEISDQEFESESISEEDQNSVSSNDEVDYESDSSNDD